MNRSTATRFLFTGTAKWCRDLASLVNRYAADAGKADCAPATPAGFLRFPAASLSADHVIRVGFRPAMGNIKARLFDATWRFCRHRNPSATWTYYWIGSDVIHHVADFANDRLVGDLRDASSCAHLAGAPWFVDELEKAGVSASASLFPLDLPDDIEWTSSVNSRRALTYLPDQRHGFYGSDIVVRLAREFPHLHIDVVGGRGDWCKDGPPNMQFHGWVGGLGPLLAARPVVVRLVPHDGIGGTVREALVYGCPVIYTYDIPFVHYVPYGSYDAVKRALVSIGEREASDLEASLRDGAAYARREWDPETLTRNLISAIQSGTSK